MATDGRAHHNPAKPTYTYTNTSLSVRHGLSLRLSMNPPYLVFMGRPHFAEMHLRSQLERIAGERVSCIGNARLTTACSSNGHPWPLGGNVGRPAGSFTKLLRNRDSRVAAQASRDPRCVSTTQYTIGPCIYHQPTVWAPLNNHR